MVKEMTMAMIRGVATTGSFRNRYGIETTHSVVNRAMAMRKVTRVPR